MVNSMTFARKHLSIAVRQIMLLCARICFLSAPFYGSSHTMIATIQLQAGLAPADQQRVERLPIAEGMPDRGRSPAF
jgi:hypothetical protein